MYKPVPRQPLTQQVLRSLVRQIAAHNLGVGDRLPTERDLAAELGVSRSTVREALRSLEAIGAVTRRPKRGAVLAPVDFGLVAEISQALMLRSTADLRELLGARCLLELGLLPLVVQQAGAADYEAMEAANRQGEAELAAGWLPVEGDLAFHRALLQASHNRFVIQFGALLDEFFRSIQPRLKSNPAASQRTLAEHRKIISALKAGNARKAQRLMEKHLQQYWRMAGLRATDAGRRGAASRGLKRASQRKETQS